MSYNHKSLATFLYTSYGTQTQGLTKQWETTVSTTTNLVVFKYIYCRGTLTPNDFLLTYLDNGVNVRHVRPRELLQVHRTHTTLQITVCQDNSDVNPYKPTVPQKNNYIHTISFFEKMGINLYFAKYLRKGCWFVFHYHWNIAHSIE